MRTIAIRAKQASYEMAHASTDRKNRALEEIMGNLTRNQGDILAANGEDIAAAEANGLAPALLDRLSLANRLDSMIREIGHAIELSDPIGERFDERMLQNGLQLAKWRIPIGVLGVIYESRPNVTLEISSLTIKTGNCAILRGGTEALRTNRLLVRSVQESLLAAGLPRDAVQLIDDPDRAKVKELLGLHEYVDLIVPRGSSDLQRFCRENSRVPVITGGIGICHLFVDESADLDQAIGVIDNAKTQRPTVCNALDTLLVHAAIAPRFVPRVVAALGQAKVSFRLDPRAWELSPACSLAKEEDWDTEWLSLVLGIKVVDSLEEAIGHIRLHGTGHSEGILTEDRQNSARFVREVDAAAVYVNASTRFTDGGQFGLGGEVAISTQKLHARGPMGLQELTSYKWVAQGQYHVRTGE